MTEHLEKSSEENEFLIKKIREKVFVNCNITVELGKAEVNGTEVSVILGEARLEDSTLAEVAEKVKGEGMTAFAMDAQISVDGNPIVWLCDGKKHVGSGQPFLIRGGNDVDGLAPVGTIGVTIISDMAGYPDHILTGCKGEVLTLDNSVRRATIDDYPDVPEELKAEVLKRRRLECTLYLDGALYAKGWITNPDSICDPNLPMAERFRFVIAELVSA